MKKTAILLIALMVISVGFLSGCVNEEKTENGEASYTVTLTINEEHKILTNLRFSFILRHIEVLGFVGEEKSGYVLIDILENSSRLLIEGKKLGVNIGTSPIYDGNLLGGKVWIKVLKIEENSAEFRVLFVRDEI